jgi:Uma2 family endonuclease
VPEVWVVSPEARTVEILQLHEGNLHTVQLVSQGELVPKCFPRVRVEVSAIWPD